jgi:hypothetical protein
MALSYVINALDGAITMDKEIDLEDSATYFIKYFSKRSSDLFASSSVNETDFA